MLGFNLMKSLFVILSILLSTSCFSSTQELHLSNKVLGEITLPQKISHSGNVLILKFDDWYFSHEVINPKEYYNTIDLTGIEHEFLKSTFYPELRQSFPNWLRELANEQAISFGLSDGDIFNKKFEGFEILSNYNLNSKQGNIFIFEEHQIHYVNFSGERAHYTNLLNSIRSK